MKPGLMLSHDLAKLAEQKPDFTKFTEGVVKQLQLKHKNNVNFHKMLDKWRHSGHTVKSSDELIKCIRGNR